MILGNQGAGSIGQGHEKVECARADRDRCAIGEQETLGRNELEAVEAARRRAFVGRRGVHEACHKSNGSPAGATRGGATFKKCLRGTSGSGEMQCDAVDRDTTLELCEHRETR
jgi:hypothetical protein